VKNYARIIIRITYRRKNTTRRMNGNRKNEQNGVI
jgi:hypothetical protein